MSSTPAGNNEDSRLLIPGTPNPEEERETQTHTQTSRRFQTLLDLLTSDKPDRTSTRRLGLFTLLGCCGSATWRRRSSSSPSPPPENGVVVIENPGGGMNLAEALAAEREFRAEETTTPETERVSLMRLLETAEEEERETEEEVGKGNDRVCCCVCMVREKGAAMIPCGHTFCRICSKEVWVNRGSCPLCNRLILDILNIF